MRGKVFSFMAVLVFSAGVAFSAPQPAGMSGQMGGGQMGGGQMGGQGQMGGRMGPRQRRMNIDQRVARMKSDLNLTDKQAGRVKALFERQERNRQTWRDSHPQASRAEMREHRRQMYTAMNKGLKKILTPEQFKKHEEMMRQRMKMRRGMRNRQQQGPPQD